MVVLGLVYALWLVWLVPESRAGLLVCGARLQGTLEVVPVHWWAELGAGLGPLLGNILSRGGCRHRVLMRVTRTVSLIIVLLCFMSAQEKSVDQPSNPFLSS